MKKAIGASADLFSGDAAGILKRQKVKVHGCVIYQKNAAGK